MLASFRCLGISILNALPRTPSEKIKKDVLQSAKPDLNDDSWDHVDDVA